MRTPFRLVPDVIDQDSVKALRELLQQAQDGELLGIAFVAMYRGRHYIANTTGEAKRNPTFTRGMIAALDDKLCIQIHGRAQ